MTVAEIREKICNTMSRFEDLANRNKKVSANEVNLLLGKICSMLDELEPVTAKFVDEETINKIAREQAKLELHTENNEIYYTCSKCGTITYNPLDNYCSFCGARMEVEDDTTPTNV